jgi:hypothetical protein
MRKALLLFFGGMLLLNLMISIGIFFQLSEQQLTPDFATSRATLRVSATPQSHLTQTPQGTPTVNGGHGTFVLNIPLVGDVELPELISIGAALFTLLGAIVTYWYVRIARKDLTLTAYDHAVQGILDLKQTFAERPEIFAEQMRRNPGIRQFIPAYMQDDIPTFLAFAGGMWRFSYVYSVMQRWRKFKLTPKERDGLEKEMELWLVNIPGFYHVYQSHISRLRAHNEDFLKFLEQVYTSPDFLQAQKNFTIPPMNHASKGRSNTLAARLFRNGGRLALRSLFWCLMK